jgi:hypothetical protein
MRWFLLAGIVVLTGCDYGSSPLPSVAEVARVDRAISRVPCIGKAELWYREYQYRTTLRDLPVALWRLDRNTIDFYLTKADFPADAMVFLEPPRPTFKWRFDSTPTDLAQGSYNVATDELQLDFCGPNYPAENGR